MRVLSRVLFPEPDFPLPTPNSVIRPTSALARERSTEVAGRPRYKLDLGALRQQKRIFNVDPQIANGVLDLGVTQQNLDRANVACRSVNHGGLCLGGSACRTRIYAGLSR